MSDLIEELKPCPFCDSHNIQSETNEFGNSYFYCGDCNAQGPTDLADQSGLWNKRADQLEQLQARVEELKGAYDWQKQELANKARKITSLLAALNGLVALKDYKDINGKDSYYQKQQPIVWKNARKVLSPTKTLAEHGEKE